MLERLLRAGVYGERRSVGEGLRVREIILRMRNGVVDSANLLWVSRRRVHADRVHVNIERFDDMSRGWFLINHLRIIVVAVIVSIIDDGRPLTACLPLLESRGH